MQERRETGRIARHLKELRKRRKSRDKWDKFPCGCALLVGAGCSVTAGIPSARGFIRKIKQDFREEWEDAGSPKDYVGCMSALGEYRRFFIQKIVDNSKCLNPAHVAIGQLLKESFVDRILTTNFDPLLVRACAFVGEEPAVYDLPSLAHTEFSRDRIALPAIFYLHGQHSGVVHLNIDADFQSYGEFLRPLIRDTSEECTWIVVGYSGENDPTFAQFEKLPELKNRLYWVAHQENQPCERVARLLTSSDKAYLVRGFDADSFLVSLARELDCFPPEPIMAPFTHLSGVVDRVPVSARFRNAKEGPQQETAHKISSATSRIHKIRALVEGPGDELGGEPPLNCPDPKAGLVPACRSSM